MTRAFLLLSLVLASQLDDVPAPTPLNFTAEPRQLQWRFGFDLGNAIALEAPELNPEDDIKTASQEAERILPRPFLDVGLLLLPVSKVRMRSDRLVNPRRWTLLDLHGKTRSATFQGLGVFTGRRLTSSEGGYHLVSVPTMDAPFFGTRKEAAAEDLVFGFAGPVKGKLQVHTKLSETKWENLLPVEDPTTAGLPTDFMSAKQTLDDHPPEDRQRFLYGTSIEAVMKNRIAKLWLLNYSHPDTTMGTHPWGIFSEEGDRLVPLYVYRPSQSGDAYVAYFTAAVDLNQDGNDELIVEASYRVGTAYKVISNVGGKYQETFTSYYRGQ